MLKEPKLFNLVQILNKQMSQYLDFSQMPYSIFSFNKVYICVHIHRLYGNKNYLYYG